MPLKGRYDIEGLDATNCVVCHGFKHLLVSLEGIDAADLFAQMPDELMDELIRLAGEERCKTAIGAEVRR